MRIIILLIIFLLAAPFFASASMMGRVIEEQEIRDFVPQPVLLQPRGEKVVLTGKDTLEFTWSPHEGNHMNRRCYDFRLYKGYDMYEKNLIFKEEVAPNISSKKIDSKKFENGQTYTWSLRQMYDDSSKSQKSYHSFKVIK